MVGLISKILIDLIDRVAGAEKSREIYRRAGIPDKTRHRINEVYDDGEWRRLLAAACEVLGLTQEQAEEQAAMLEEFRQLVEKIDYAQSIIGTRPADAKVGGPIETVNIQEFSADTAKERGGSLSAHDPGPDGGATFTLELPLEESRVES